MIELTARIIHAERYGAQNNCLWLVDRMVYAWRNGHASDVIRSQGDTRHLARAYTIAAILRGEVVPVGEEDTPNND